MQHLFDGGQPEVPAVSAAEDARAGRLGVKSRSGFFAYDDRGVRAPASGADGRPRPACRSRAAAPRSSPTSRTATSPPSRGSRAQILAEVKPGHGATDARDPRPLPGGRRACGDGRHPLRQRDPGRALSGRGGEDADPRLPSGALLSRLVRAQAGRGQSVGWGRSSRPASNRRGSRTPRPRPGRAGVTGRRQLTVDGLRFARSSARQGTDRSCRAGSRSERAHGLADAGDAGRPARRSARRTSPPIRTGGAEPPPGGSAGRWDRNTQR